MNKKIAFIGVGNMAGAILGGILSGGGEFKAGDVVLYDKLAEKLNAYPTLRAAKSIADAVECGDYILFAVKPQNFPEMLDEIGNSNVDLSGKVFITIAAGIKTDTITDCLGPVPVVRVMPNTPLLVGSGTTALCRNEYVSDKDFKVAFSLFSSLGETVELKENGMNEIIALTSSSPAYVFLFIKSMADASKAQGLELEYDEIIRLCCSAFIGSAKLLMESDEMPEQLIRRVTSPGGTTEKAMQVFEKYNIADIIKQAMDECTKRAYELSGE